MLEPSNTLRGVPPPKAKTVGVFFKNTPKSERGGEKSSKSLDISRYFCYSGIVKKCASRKKGEKI